MSEKVIVKREVLLDQCTKIFVAAGMRQDEAAVVADNLVAADQTGMDSHGVMRVPAYTKRLRDGGTLPHSEIEVVRETPTTAVIDGHNGMGQVVSKFAMEKCIEKAKKCGVAFVAVRGSNHFGMASYFTRMALEHNMIGMCSTSPAAHLLAPTGGVEPILDNNPFSFAVPAGKEYPVVLDMATSVVSRGKLASAAKRGDKIPTTWAMTIDGEPTDDPKLGFDGILLPVGGYKGYGLTVISGVMAAMLSNAALMSRDICDFYVDTDKEQNIGHLFGCIDIQVFCDVDDFKHRMDEMIDEIHNCRKAPGVDRILLPGERSGRTADKNAVEGIPLNETVFKDLNDVAVSYGLQPIQQG